MEDLKKVGIIKLDNHGGAVKGVCNPMIEAFIENMFVHIKSCSRHVYGIPVVKFGAKRIAQTIVDRGIVREGQLYSPISLCRRASDKRSLYELLNGRYMPRTVFNRERTHELRFPIIVKPQRGWGGQGAFVSDNRHTLPYGEYCYQEHLSIKHEYRYTMVKDSLIFKAERVPLNDKAIALRNADVYTSTDLVDERNTFRWRVWPVVSENRNHLARLSIAREVMRTTGLKYAGIDLATDIHGRHWLIEVNTSPGMTHNQSVLLYESVFEDWYGRPVEPETKQTLDVFGRILIEARKKYVTSDYTVDAE